MIDNRSSDHKILRGFSVAFIFLLLAKFIGAIKEVVIAHSYGTSLAADVYALGFAIANAPVTLTSMAANMILIPYFVARRQDPEKTPRSDADIILWSGLLSILTSSGVFWLMHAGGVLMRMNPESADSLSHQAAGIALMVPPGIFATILAARLMAAKRQINSLFEAIPSLVLIVGLLLFEKQLAANTLLAWLTCLGMFAYLGALVLADISAVVELSPRRLRPSLPSRGRVGEVGLILSAQSVFVFSGVFLDQLAAAGLPPGDNAALSYANRLILLITSLGATAVGRAVLPVMAEARLEGRGHEYVLTRRWSAYLAVFGVISCLLGYLLAPTVIRILFEHGEFTAHDTQQVVEVLRVGLLMLPLYFPSLILAQSVVVQRRFVLLLSANTLASVIKISILWLFLDRWGLPLIMHATVARQVVSLLVMLPALHPPEAKGEE